MRKIASIAANEWTPWGGSEHCWSAAAERLVRRGVQVWISTKDWGTPVKEMEYLHSLGCRIIYRRLPSLMKRLGQKFFPGREYAREHVRMLGANADLIVVSQGSNLDGLNWMEAAKNDGYRYAVISQAAAEAWWPDDDVAERLAVCYEGASAAYFVSQANLELSRRQFGTSIRRARVIQNPFNVRYDAQPQWPIDSSRELSLACVGRLEVRAKGQDLLVEVLALPHWRERNIHVTLVGKGRNERALRYLVDDSNLTSIDFAGFVNDIEEVWSKHHALVLPSRFEGLPLALVEAMLCARAAIVTDVAGNKELVRDGINGFIATAPTVQHLDEAMNRAWDSRHHLMDIGNAAATDVRQWLSKDPSEDFIQELTALVDDTPER
jgi:glycosyltransferase involved in cell wall biosynthesis